MSAEGKGVIPRIDVHGPDKCPLTDDIQWYAGYVRLVADDFSWTWTEKDTDEERCRRKIDKLAERVEELDQALYDARAYLDPKLGPADPRGALDILDKMLDHVRQECPHCHAPGETYWWFSKANAYKCFACGVGGRGD